MGKTRTSSNKLVLNESHGASIITEESRYQERPSLSRLTMATAPTTARLDVNLAVHGDVLIMTSHEQLIVPRESDLLPVFKDEGEDIPTACPHENSRETDDMGDTPLQSNIDIYTTSEDSCLTLRTLQR
jgi:hypothetical protein